ncbi:MAG: ABC transporter ATP-binding protein [Planctomycetota bacterium]
MLSAQHLTKWYGPTLAVDDLSLELEPGKIVGFLGPNGAGKSTTIRMLTGYLPPTTGRATLDGHDVMTAAAAARRKLGYLPESNPLYPEMRVDEYLHFCGRLHRMPRKTRTARMDIVTDRCGLSHLRRRTIGRLSKGNRQRVGLAAALLHEPPVLILDEPTAGLDPHQIGHVRELLRDLAGHHTVLLSSHILPEVQRVADRVVIIAHGRVVADGTPRDLQRRADDNAGETTVCLQARATPDDLRAALGPLTDLTLTDARPHAPGSSWTAARVTPLTGRDPRPDLARVLADAAIPLRELRRDAPTLEQFFIRVTDTAAADFPPPPEDATP